MKNVVEFGSLKPGDRFYDLVPNGDLLAWEGGSGGFVRGAEYVKIEPREYKKNTWSSVRQINACSVRHSEYCWITPSHRVEKIEVVAPANPQISNTETEII